MRARFIDNAARRGIERAARVDAIVGAAAAFLGLVGLLLAGMPA